MRTLLFFVAGVVATSAAEVEPQPFLAALKPLMEAADYLGSPFSAAEKSSLQQCMEQHDAAAVAKAEALLDAHCLFVVNINPLRSYSNN